jgi:hypothetical protein
MQQICPEKFLLYFGKEQQQQQGHHHRWKVSATRKSWHDYCRQDPFHWSPKEEKVWVFISLLISRVSLNFTPPIIFIYFFNIYD